MSADIISYIIRSSLSLALLYLFFTFFLGRENMHKFNRFYLLTSLIFSFAVPLLTFPDFVAAASITNSFGIADLQDGYYQLKTITLQQGNQFNFSWIIPSVYFCISFVLLIRFLINLIRLEISKSIHPTVISEGHKIVLINELVLPYSFLSTVYVNSVEYKAGRIPGELFSHEFTHIAQRHSLDIIFIELLKVFFWFNPLLFFYKKAIMLNHEYLADEAVTKSKKNFTAYIDIILNIVFRNNNSYLASSFNYSFTKKRLLMMTKNNFSKRAILKKIAVIPLFLAMGLLVINAQDTTRSVKVFMQPPPPPPPPPPFGYNTWWAPILKEHNVIPNPSKCRYSQNFFETGDQCSSENGIFTMKEAFLLIKSSDKFYTIIKSRSAIHDSNKKTIEANDGKKEVYSYVSGGSKLENRIYFNKRLFQLSKNDLISAYEPPPPPPPPLLPPPPPPPPPLKN